MQYVDLYAHSGEVGIKCIKPLFCTRSGIMLRCSAVDCIHCGEVFALTLHGCELHVHTSRVVDLHLFVLGLHSFSGKVDMPVDCIHRLARSTSCMSLIE